MIETPQFSVAGEKKVELDKEGDFATETVKTLESVRENATTPSVAETLPSLVM